MVQSMAVCSAWSMAEMMVVQRALMTAVCLVRLLVDS